MPPLRHWLLGIGLCSASGYLGYHHVYVPRVYQQEPLERQWELERSKAQQLWQELVLLEKFAPQVDQGQKKSEDVSIRPRSFCSKERNQKKLSLFYELQRARSSLLDVLTSRNPIIARSISYSQAIDYLHRVQRLQITYCTPLSFHQDSLTLIQKVKYMFSLCLYIFVFQVLPVFIPFSFLDVDLFHLVSKYIVLTLEIPCSMTIAEKVDPEKVVDGSHAISSKEKGKLKLRSMHPAASKLREQASSLKIILPAQHWIEEVGFWACENNPLLFSDLDFDTIWAMMESSRCISYQKWWERMFSPFPQVSLEIRKMEKTSYMGYPVIADCGKVTPQTPFIPVTVTGLHSLLHAVKMKKPEERTEDRSCRQEKMDLYTKVVEQQYQKRRNGTEADNNVEKGNINTEKREPESIKKQERKVFCHDREKSDLDSLLFFSSSHPTIRYILRRYFPPVYGNTSQKLYKTDENSGLHFYFGNPRSSEKDLMKEVLEAWKNEKM